MNLKQQILLIICLFLTLSSQAQELTVKSMKATNDLSASQHRRMDRNNELCGLVKVRLATTGAQFEGNVIPPVEYKTGEYWVYMSKGSRELHIKHPSFLPVEVHFANYGLSRGVQSLTTYTLTLAMPQTDNLNIDDGMRYLVIEVEPGNATVLVDGKQQEVKNGMAKIRLTQGVHNYIVSAVGYSTKQGSVEVEMEKKQLSVRLESAMASLSVQCPTDGVNIYINDELRGKAPWQGLLLGGDYLVEARKNGYRNSQRSIRIVDNERQTVVLPALQAIIGNLDVNYDPVGTEVWLDGKKLGTSPDIFREVFVGKHTLKLSSNGYQQKELLIEVEEGKTKSVTGSLLKQTTELSEIAGKTDAQIVDIAQSYYWGSNGKTKNYDKAFNLMKVAADHGHALAEYNMGCLFYFGHGVQKDLRQALAYWEKSAEKGEVGAVANIGCIYANGGTGVERDYNKAYYYFDKSVRMGGTPESYANLATCYELGRGVEKDNKKADQLREEGGRRGSNFCLGWGFYYGKARKKDYHRAIYYFQKAIDDNDSDEGRYFLGECYANGYGTTKDLAKAVELYAKASERDYIPAMVRLAQCYETGVGVQKDLLQAKYWYQKAADNGDKEALKRLNKLNSSTQN